MGNSTQFGLNPAAKTSYKHNGTRVNAKKKTNTATGDLQQCSIRKKGRKKMLDKKSH